MTSYLLCCDWGTTSFRLRLVNTSDNTVIDEYQSKEGIASTFRSWQEAGSPDRFDFYASTLKLAIDELSRTSAKALNNIPVIVSGMASSSIGMEEIPYAPVPFSLDGSNVSARLFKEFNGQRGLLAIVSGVKTHNDVMRGEEAQLMGLFCLKEFNLSRDRKSIFVFPGTHSKHMRVEREKMLSFETFMTGEVFNILSEHSILKDSITNGADFTDPENQMAFSKGVELSGSLNLLNSLFSVRTNQLFSVFPKEQNAFFLSGLLIGSELSQLADAKYDELVVCSGRNLYEQYKLAAKTFSFKENVSFIEPDLIDKATIAGQVRIFKALTDFYE